MQEKVVEYANQGYNCAQCLLKAAEEHYGLQLPPEMYHSVEAVNNGFGIGGICSAMVAAVMVLGLLLPPERAKSLRLILFYRFHETYKTFQCCSLSVCHSTCEPVLRTIAAITQELIDGERCHCKYRE